MGFERSLKDFSLQDKIYISALILPDMIYYLPGLKRHKIVRP